MAGAGTGIGLMARGAVGPQLEAGKIAVRRLSNREVRRQWHAVTLRNQPSPPHLVEFLQLLSNFSPKQARLRA
jgi:DNA-binding transcriptional LysR family regulator